MTEARRFRVQGVVQGVGFRAWVQGLCRRSRATGWVRNRLDSSVEAFVQTDPDTLDRIERLLWQGPLGSRVDSVEVERTERDPGWTTFEVIATE